MSWCSTAKSIEDWLQVDDEVFADDVFAVGGDKDYEDESDYEHMLEGVHFVVDIQGQ